MNNDTNNYDTNVNNNNDHSIAIVIVNIDISIRRNKDIRILMKPTPHFYPYHSFVFGNWT